MRTTMKRTWSIDARQCRSKKQRGRFGTVCSRKNAIAAKRVVKIGREPQRVSVVSDIRVYASGSTSPRLSAAGDVRASVTGAPSGAQKCRRSHRHSPSPPLPSAAGMYAQNCSDRRGSKLTLAVNNTSSSNVNRRCSRIRRWFVIRHRSLGAPLIGNSRMNGWAAVSTGACGARGGGGRICTPDRTPRHEPGTRKLQKLYSRPTLVVQQESRCLFRRLSSATQLHRTLVLALQQRSFYLET